MANQPNRIDQIPQHLAQYEDHDPNAVVPKVYPLPGTDHAPDFASQDEMEVYLRQRLEPEASPSRRLVLQATGRTLPVIRRIQDGHKQITRKRKTDEWLIRPRTAVAVVLGSAAIINTIGNTDTIGQSAKWLVDEVHSWFSDPDPVKKPVTIKSKTPGKVVDVPIDISAATTDVSGNKITVDPLAIKAGTDKVKVLVDKQHGKVISMKVTGETSDDWAAKGDKAFGQHDKENQILGTQIATKAYPLIKSELAGTVLAGVKPTFGQHESVLSRDHHMLEKLITEAKTHGFDSLEAAVQAVDHGQLLKGDLHDKIEKYIIAERGEHIDVQVELPGKAVTHVTHTTRKIPGVEHFPHVPKPHFYPLAFPLFPRRRREKYVTMKPRRKFTFEPKEIMRPTIIHEEPDQVWLRVRPEAVNSDGTLKENAWAYTRKYEHLLRDDRITEVLRADFDNPEGEEKSLRIMFVDHKPAKETVDVFSELLTKFAAMDGGKIADRVGAIFIYPTKNAGTGHKNPKRIAMGLDKQHHEDILGTYTYILDLIEMHMPSKLDPKELEALLAQFNGPAFVLAHETGIGHATDDSDEPLKLRRVTTSGIPNAYIIDGDPRARKMQPLEDTLHNLPANERDRETPVMFDIVYPVPDKNDEIVMVPARVAEGDPRLAHAHEVTIVGFKPTQYAGTDVSEHYAETGASVTTGIEIPFEEANVVVTSYPTTSGKPAVFATSYRPDVRAQQLVTRSVGAIDGEFPIKFESQPEITITHMLPQYDPLIREEMIRTRQLQTLTPREMIAILARSTRRKKV